MIIIPSTLIMYYDPPHHYSLGSLTSSSLIKTNHMIGPLQKYTTKPCITQDQQLHSIFVCVYNDENWWCVFCIFVFFSECTLKYLKKGISILLSQAVNISTAESCTNLYLKLKVTFVTHSWLLSKIVMAA